MKFNEIISYIGNIFTYMIAFVQSNEIIQWIELILSIIVSVVLLAYRLWRWWTEANKDGKITKDEIKDGIDIIVDGVEDIKKKGEKKDDNSRKD